MLGREPEADERDVGSLASGHRADLGGVDLTGDHLVAEVGDDLSEQPEPFSLLIGDQHSEVRGFVVGRHNSRIVSGATGSPETVDDLSGFPCDRVVASRRGTLGSGGARDRGAVRRGAHETSRQACLLSSERVAAPNSRPSSRVGDKASRLEARFGCAHVRSSSYDPPAGSPAPLSRGHPPRRVSRRASSASCSCFTPAPALHRWVRPSSRRASRSCSAQQPLHRRRWTAARMRWIGLLDHAAIYVLIAGTYTPFALLVLHPGWRLPILAIVWGGGLAATLRRLSGRRAHLGRRRHVRRPRVDLPDRHAADRRAHRARPDLAARRRRNRLHRRRARLRATETRSLPRHFGYHEVFHALVVVAVACQYTTIAFFVLPQA